MLASASLVRPPDRRGSPVSTLAARPGHHPSQSVREWIVLARAGERAGPGGA
ncbi:hypothetical protein [Alloactinosynnema sp. L-07]|nr:hypothetical protein [Alloactinosynnema sp. L-07]